MQKTRAELSLILALLLGSFATCGATPRGLADASSFLQQHASAALTPDLPLSSEFSVWSNKTALMAQLEEFNKEAETHSEEEGIRFYEAVRRLQNLSNASTEEKGLMLMQEAGKIFGGGPWYNDVYDKFNELTTRFKKWTGRSQAFPCITSPVQLVVNIVGAVFASIVTTTCPTTVACYSEGIESARYILVAMQHFAGLFSYCSKTYTMSALCTSALFYTTANAAGMASAGTAISYKCPKATVDKAKKVGRLGVNDIQCALGFGKSGVYLGLAVYQMIDIIMKWDKNTANKDVTKGNEPAKFYLGHPYKALISQFGATVAWIVQIIFLMLGNCGGSNGKMVCYGEISEAVAFVAQTLTGLLMGNSYCLDRDNRKAVMERHTDTSNLEDEDSVVKTRKMRSISVVDPKIIAQSQGGSTPFDKDVIKRKSTVGEAPLSGGTAGGTNVIDSDLDIVPPEDDGKIDSDDVVDNDLVDLDITDEEP